jgi:thymidylate synthase (FAD)
MRFVTPKVTLLGKTELNREGMREFLEDSYGGVDWFENRYADVEIPMHEIIIEAHGRLCYDSYSAEGGNPNVTRIREDRIEYLTNLIKSGHGSVLEHAVFNFGIRNTSVVMTQELIRHRVGTAISQESGRYVRPTELLIVDTPYMQDPRNRASMELKFDRVWDDYIDEVNSHDWDNMPFSKKKELTSELRGMLPMRRATNLAWSGNVRALRHIIDLRTSPHAEWEIRFVFSQVLDIMLEESIALFEDLR